MKRLKAIIHEEILYVSIAVLLLVPNFSRIFTGDTASHDTAKAAVNEQFQPRLVAEITSVDDLLVLADYIADSLHVKPQTLAYAEIVTKLVKNRFYHGYSHYSLQENWLAVLCGMFVWDHLSAIVLPDDILKYPMAACSQQSIVLAESFKRKGLPYRKVGFDHHFALESKIDDQWFYFDPNLEPDFSAVHRKSLQLLVEEKALYQIYQNKMDSTTLDWALSGMYFGDIDDDLAPRAAFFHRVTKLLSKSVFLIPLILLIIRVKKES